MTTRASTGVSADTARSAVATRVRWRATPGGIAAYADELERQLAADGSADREQWIIDNWTAVCAEIAASQAVSVGVASHQLVHQQHSQPSLLLPVIPHRHPHQRRLSHVDPIPPRIASLIQLLRRISPFLQLRWSARGLSDAQPFLEWDTMAQPGFSPDRRMYFSPPPGTPGAMHIEMLPLHRHPAWQGAIAHVRLNFGNAAPGAEIVLQALFSQYDTRHNINNFDF